MGRVLLGDVSGSKEFRRLEGHPESEAVESVGPLPQIQNALRWILDCVREGDLL